MAKVKLAKVVGMSGAAWEPDAFHRVEGGRNAWRVDDDGIYVLGEDTPRVYSDRSLKLTVQNVARMHTEDIRTIAEVFGFDPPLLVAIIVTESAGVAASRWEAHLGDHSFGITQNLTETATGIGRLIGWPREPSPDSDNGEWWMPHKPYPRTKEELSIRRVDGKNVNRKWDAYEKWDAFLGNPQRSLGLGAAYLDYNNRRFELRGDPVLLYASYNAGSPRPTTHNPWGLINAHPALEGFVRAYGDACAAWAALAAPT